MIGFQVSEVLIKEIFLDIGNQLGCCVSTFVEIFKVVWLAWEDAAKWLVRRLTLVAHDGCSNRAVKRPNLNFNLILMLGYRKITIL